MKEGQDKTSLNVLSERGAIQLTSYCLLLFSDHPNLEPRHFVDEKVVNENHKDFMFLECILFITEVRFVPQGSAPDIRQFWLWFSLPPWFALVEVHGRFVVVSEVLSLNELKQRD